MASDARHAMRGGELMLSEQLQPRGGTVAAAHGANFSRSALRIFTNIQITFSGMEKNYSLDHFIA